VIGRIRGKLLEKQAPELLVDVNGVGYEIHAPMTTIYQLPALGESVELFTHLIVREDAHLLYGFASVQDRALFRALIKVNGVGPKLALTILSGMDVADFVRCVRDGNAVGLVKLPGVGKKTAERLLIEMRDRLRDWHVDGMAANECSAQLPMRGHDYLLEAESALIALGYKPQEATKMIAAVKTEDANSEALIRAALKRAVKN
jgi:holliday junction DNA helicase RuvA